MDSPVWWFVALCVMYAAFFYGLGIIRGRRAEQRRIREMKYVLVRRSFPIHWSDLVSEPRELHERR